MLFITIATWEPEKREQIVKRRQQGPMVPEGVKLIGQWSDIGGGRAFSLFETDDPKLMMPASYAWNDIVRIEVVPVIEAEEVMKFIASV